MNHEDLGAEVRKWTQHVIEFEKVVGSERTNNAHCREQMRRKKGKNGERASL